MPLMAHQLSAGPIGVRPPVRTVIRHRRCLGSRRTPLRLRLDKAIAAVPRHILREFLDDARSIGIKYNDALVAVLIAGWPENRTDERFAGIVENIAGIVWCRGRRYDWRNAFSDNFNPA